MHCNPHVGANIGDGSEELSDDLLQTRCGDVNGGIETYSAESPSLRRESSSVLRDPEEIEAESDQDDPADTI